MSNCDQRHLACEKCFRYFRRLWRAPRRIYEIFLVVLRIHQLVEQALPRQAEERGPSKVTWIDGRWWKGSSYKSAEARSGWRKIGLAVAATTVMVVSLGYPGYLYPGYLVLSRITADSAGITYRGPRSCRTARA